MFNVDRALKSSRIMQALTGISPKEFRTLAGKFHEILEYHQQNKTHTAQGKLRKNKPGSGQPHTLRTAFEKLFFLLFYIKCYPTFDVAGFFFNVDRSRPCRWVRELLPILEQTLERKVVLPKRQIHSVDEFLEYFPEVEEVLVDGSERPTQRHKNDDQQRQHYSGKQKRHTKQNQVMSDENDRILAVTPSVPGSQHDYRQFQESGLPDAIPDDIGFWADSAYVGVATDYPDKKKLAIPLKRPPGGELTREEKEYNREISQVRVKVEHVIGRLKRFGSLFQVFRNKKSELHDAFMLVAAGIWNYHLEVT